MDMSAKRTSSGTLLEMSRVSSRDMGGPLVDELETVRDEELDVVGGRRW